MSNFFLSHQTVNHRSQGTLTSKAIPKKYGHLQQGTRYEQAFSHIVLRSFTFIFINDLGFALHVCVLMALDLLGAFAKGLWADFPKEKI